MEIESQLNGNVPTFFQKKKKLCLFEKRIICLYFFVTAFTGEGKTLWLIFFFYYVYFFLFPILVEQVQSYEDFSCFLLCPRRNDTKAMEVSKRFSLFSIFRSLLKEVRDLKLVEIPWHVRIILYIFRISKFSSMYTVWQLMT